MGVFYELDEALKKQTPRKPNLSGNHSYLCPNCNRFLDRHEQAHGNIDIPYCKWCGQKLDWTALDNEWRDKDADKG